MKKYRRSSVKVFAALAALCALMIIAGIVLVLYIPGQLHWILFLLGTGISMGIVFSAILIPCARNYLLLDDEKIVLPITHAPRLRLKRNPIAFREIKGIKVTTYQGDGVISKDTTIYRFILNNGLEFTVTFYSYGKEAEQEIVAHLKAHIRFL